MRNNSLKIGAWAAILVPQGDEAESTYGLAASTQKTSSAIWRRMGRLERLAVRCTLSVLQEQSTGNLVFCSRHGNMESLTSMLRGIVAGELLSPMAFSGSVHNATPGMVGQIRNEKLSHTALAAGEQTFVAGLTETYARLASGECDDVTLTYAELPLSEPFKTFDDEHLPGLALSLRLVLPDHPDETPAAPMPSGQRGVIALLDALRDGGGHMAFGGGQWALQAH